MTQQLIRVHIQPNDYVTIPAIVRGPLALHRTIEATPAGFWGAIGKEWMVTHAESGVTVGEFCWQQWVARWKFRRLLALDWSTFTWNHDGTRFHFDGIPDMALAIDAAANKRDYYGTEARNG